MWRIRLVYTSERRAFFVFSRHFEANSLTMMMMRLLCQERQSPLAMILRRAAPCMVYVGENSKPEVSNLKTEAGMGWGSWGWDSEPLSPAMGLGSTLQGSATVLRTTMSFPRFACLKPNSITLAGSELAPGSEQAPNQLRTSSELAPNRFGASSEPANIMEFGFTMACRDTFVLV